MTSQETSSPIGLAPSGEAVLPVVDLQTVPDINIRVMVGVVHSQVLGSEVHIE